MHEHEHGHDHAHDHDQPGASTTDEVLEDEHYGLVDPESASPGAPAQSPTTGPGASGHLPTTQPSESPRAGTGTDDVLDPEV